MGDMAKVHTSPIVLVVIAVVVVVLQFESLYIKNYKRYIQV